MPDLPATIYVPIAGALIGALGAVVGIASKIISVLWGRNIALSDRQVEASKEGTAAMDKVATSNAAVAEALRANTKVNEEIRNAVLGRQGPGHPRE